MPQSLSAVYLHGVFSTKDRRAFLEDCGFRAEVHAYLGGVSGQLECPSLIVGGLADHIHILCRLGRRITQADWVKEVKRVSSIWIKERNPEMKMFSWQSGYGLFSVSVSNLDRVTARDRGAISGIPHDSLACLPGEAC